MATRTPSLDVETALLNAADAMLRREGLGGLSARVVAAEAGVARMGIYNRFGGMDGLVDALLIRGWDDLAEATAVRGDLDPVTRLVASGRAYRRWALANREYYEAMFLTARSFASEQVLEHAMTTFNVLVGHVEFAMAAGAFAPGDAFDTAQMLLNATHGAISLEVRGVAVVENPEATYERMLHMLVRGLAPPPLHPPPPTPETGPQLRR
ncbi:MAG: TetR/AcrR family transcriptional regulator [Sporichthyaceae bacterium]